MSAAQELQNDLVILEPASEANVDLLVRWTLDPVAQGPYKRVPETSAAQLRDLFLHEQSREYFVIRVVPGDTPVGRLYWRAWRFTPDPDAIDWELNVFLAEPGVRGRGLGTSSQGLAVRHLLGRRSTRSVFAFTAVDNHPERRALLKAGLRELGPLPHPRYPVPLPEGEWCVYSTWTQVDIGPACQP